MHNLAIITPPTWKQILLVLPHSDSDFIIERMTDDEIYKAFKEVVSAKYGLVPLDKDFFYRII